MEVVFISIGRMPFLAPTLNSADSSFALVITPGFYLHLVQVADQDPASGSLYEDRLIIISRDLKSNNNSDASLTVILRRYD